MLSEPSVSQPGLPALAGFLVGGPSPTTPCQSAIALQMWPGVKHFLRAGLVSGRSDSSTSEKVCGPMAFGIDLFSIVSSSPVTIVFG